MQAVKLENSIVVPVSEALTVSQPERDNVNISFWGLSLINIRAKGKCPVCNKAFKADKRIGFLCPEHFTTPQRFQIDFRYKG